MATTSPSSAGSTEFQRRDFTASPMSADLLPDGDAHQDLLHPRKEIAPCARFQIGQLQRSRGADEECQSANVERNPSWLQNDGMRSNPTACRW